MTKALVVGAVCAACAAAPGAAAQSALVRVTANGGSFASVAPRELVSIRVECSWTPGLQFANIDGNIAVTGNAGSGSGFTSDYAPGPLVNLGSFVGGSRVGVDIAQLPAFFTGGVMAPPSANWNGLNVGSYTIDTTGMGPGQFYTVAWVPAPNAPQVRLYPSTASPQFVEAETTYVGATIHIDVPGPGTVVVVGVGVVGGGRRRGR